MYRSFASICEINLPLCEQAIFGLSDGTSRVIFERIVIIHNEWILKNEESSGKSQRMACKNE